MSEGFPLDRRSVLALGGGAAIALAIPGRAELRVGASARLLAVADLRYGLSVAHAERLKRHGAAILPLDRDLARLWFEAIEPQLTAGPLMVAGLTLPADLFGLQRLAEGSGASTLFVERVSLDHAPTRGRPRHVVSWMLRSGVEAPRLQV